MKDEKVIQEKPDLFYANYFCDKHIRVNQGGTSSGKTYTIIDLLLTLGLESRNRITVVGQDVPNLRSGAYNDVKTILSKNQLYRDWYGSPNETYRELTSLNGSVIEFKSLKDEQDARSGKRDYLFVNEANGIPYAIYRQLAIRTTKGIFIDYNPSNRFWVHEKIIGKDNAKLIISNHWHNDFLEDYQHERIESWRHEDPEFYNVYGLGLTGRLQGVIYSNWGLVDDLPTVYAKRWVGIDFGFSNDVTSVIDVRLSGGELYVKELAYEVGLLNVRIVGAGGTVKRSIEDVLIEHNIGRDVQIVGDSAEPKSIEEISHVGWNIEGAKKGQDSIRSGINILKRYRINVTRDSKGIRKELDTYRWKTDGVGEPLNVPIDAFNHSLDALRYVALNYLVGDGQDGYGISVV